MIDALAFLGAAAGILKTLGIVRWLSAMPALATAHAGADAAGRATIETAYLALNAYAGSVGELLGVQLLSGLWLLGTAAVLVGIGLRLTGLLGGLAGLLFLATHQGHAASLKHHVPIGQHLGHSDGDPGGDPLGIVDRAAPLETLVGLHVHGGILAASGQKPVLAGAKEEARDARADARLLGGLGVVLLGRLIGLFDHDGENVAHISGAIVSNEQTGRRLGPQRPIGSQHGHRYQGHHRESLDRDLRRAELEKFFHGNRGFLDHLHSGMRTESSP
jgi:hypothetical protein